MATYSPSTAGAWGSVHFIEQHAVGAFLRGVHYYAAQAMIILLGVHIVRVLATAAFRAPDGLVWMTGLVTLPLVLLWMISGNPLAGTQKGLAQIEVEANIIRDLPVVGPALRQLLIGGEQVGQLTFIRLYFLHVALLPLMVGGLLFFHIRLVRRHVLAARPSDSAAALPYWPHQTVRNMTALGIVLGAIAVLAWKWGAPLDMPADPEWEHSPRPEWYFLSLFELRRFFTGRWEPIATAAIPGACLLFLLALPAIDRLCSRRMSLVVRCATLIGGAGLWAALTIAVLARDAGDADYQASGRHEAQLAARAQQLATANGIPPEGAIRLLREDPLTQGPRLFSQHCAGCHSHIDPKGQGIPARDSSAPNLYAFAGRSWIEGLLDPQKIAGPEYFGNTAFCEGDMVSTIAAAFEGAVDNQEQAALHARLRAAAWALSAEAALPAQAAADQRDAQTVAEGIQLLTGNLSCTDCHRFHEHGDLGSAPDLTGYGSREWLIRMISDPEHERFYGGGRNDGMPAFDPASDRSEGNILTAGEVGVLADWLRRDWYKPGNR
jgi:ubiquinol-cytochrome c reductase cytochrome b subunit